MIKYTHDKEQSREYAKEAMARIQKQGLSTTPDIYELWYVYFSGQSPEIVEAIDTLAEGGQTITDERCKELYYRFLRDGRNEESIRRAGENINTTIQTVSGAVQNVKAATTEYSGKLDNVNSQITDTENPEKLKEILNNVMADTGAMMEQNKKLEEQLDMSSVVMEELQKDLENIRKEAMTDGLTGLANRKAFDEKIKAICEDAKSKQIPFSLIIADIDHFKAFNDNYGHQVGDQVLRLVAKTLTDGVKGRDVAARYGGEEFCILLPETQIESAVHVADTLRNAVATKDVINRNSGQKLGRITVSAGVAEFNLDESITDLIERADAALYTAKHNGRNQVAAAPADGAESKKKA